MKIVLLLLLIIVSGCSSASEKCNNYAEGYCASSEQVPYGVVIDSEYGKCICKYSCAEIKQIKETLDF